MKKEVRLYNVLFPVWLLWLFPQIFLIVTAPWLFFIPLYWY